MMIMGTMTITKYGVDHRHSAKIDKICVHPVKNCKRNSGTVLSTISVSLANRFNTIPTYHHESTRDWLH